jgi:site-specific DNA recombinase
MIERTCDGESAFDVIVAHSVSQFFRDAFGLEFYLRKLAKHGVRQLGDDPTQVMMRQVIALFESAKHVLRSVKENEVEVARRASRIDKKLAIDPVEAETVRPAVPTGTRARPAAGTCRPARGRPGHKTGPP